MGWIQMIRGNNLGDMKCGKNRSHYGIRYFKPTDKNEFKRKGKELYIATKQWQVKLNGQQINSLVKVLRNVGEFDGRVRKTKGVKIY